MARNAEHRKTAFVVPVPELNAGVCKIPVPLSRLSYRFVMSYGTRVLHSIVIHLKYLYS